MKAIAIVLACASWAGAETFPSTGLTALSVETAAGDIVVGAGGERVEVLVTKNDPALCVVITELKGATLILKAEDKAPAALRVSANATAVSTDAGTGRDRARGRSQRRRRLGQQRIRRHEGRGAARDRGERGRRRRPRESGQGYIN